MNHLLSNLGTFMNNFTYLLTYFKKWEKSIRRPLARPFWFFSLSFFALLSISGCPATNTVMGPTVTVTNFPPLLVSNQAIAFTYNSNDSFVLYNRGGVVESCRLVTNASNVSNALPMGLSVGISEGECVLRGRSSNLTLSTSYAIESVPVLVEASNGDGISRSPVNVSVEPRYFSGDLSRGVAAQNILGIPDGNRVITFEAGTNLIYQANAIPFASGGTGAYDDPVIIGVNNMHVGSFSLVVDYNDVLVPVNDFNNRTNSQSEQSFHVNFLFKTKRVALSQVTEVMDVPTNIQLFESFLIDTETSTTVMLENNGFGVGDLPGTTIISSTIDNPARIDNPVLNFRYRYEIGTSGLTNILQGVHRISFYFGEL